MAHPILDKLTMENGRVQSFAWPGGYPIYFLCGDCGVLCSACVNNEREQIDTAEDEHNQQWNVIAAGINWEDDTLFCDHCNKQIESAYGDNEATGV